MFPQLDPGRCTGCRQCELACVEDRYGPIAQGDVDAVVVHERRRLRIVLSDPFALRVCDNCEPHPCVSVCPHFALLVRPNKVVDLLEDRCTGCGHCIAVCDRQGIVRLNALDIAIKCDGCRDRSGGPACVAACPEDALWVDASIRLTTKKTTNK